MDICPSCNLEITAKNGNTHVPLLGLGKLADGKRICAKCYLKLDKIDRVIASNTKKYSLEQINDILNNQVVKSNDIEQQLLNVGINSKSTIWGRKELKELPNILSSDEKVKGVITGFYNGGSGILVATDVRLIFIDKGLLYGLKTEDFGLDKITSVQYEGGLLLATIKIMASGNIAKIENVEKSLGKNFSEMVRQLLSQPKSQNNTTTIIENKPDFVDQLERLAKLKDSGILSQEEFDIQKTKLLNG